MIEEIFGKLELKLETTRGALLTYNRVIARVQAEVAFENNETRPNLSAQQEL